MKNFKRVISAVIAMALSASTLVAVSASKFSDVADTASYAEAIDVLTALDIAHGYEEDGTVTFKPEGEITRAEAATLIVGALNMNNEAKNAAGTSQFADVNEKANWATGYVNVGVAQGFISGMGDGTFAPQDNVTYAQMCVMLTKITGYAEYAAGYGGWPTGYTSMAANAGINKGVAAANDAKLTRGQVAQMLYNALTAPKLVITEYALDGNKYGKADGSKAEFETLLSDKFEGYVVSASVQAIAGDTGYGKGEASIKLEKAEFTDKVFSNSKTLINTPIAVKTELDLTEYKFQSGNAIICKDENDKWNLVSFIPNSKLETKEYNAEDYVDGSNTAGTNDVTVKFDNTSVKIPNTATLYVNGAAKGTINTIANLNAYLNEAQGAVKLIKNSNGQIDKVSIDVYLLAKVDGVDYKNNETIVTFVSKATPATNNITARKIKLSDDAVAEDEAEITVTRNGEPAELKDLQVDDVIAIYYAFNPAEQEIVDPKLMKILATTEKDEGSLTVADQSENEFVLNGKTYEAVVVGDLAAQQVGSSLKVFLDPFGRIYAIDESKTADKYAIVTYFDQDDSATLLTADGTSKSYTVADDSLSVITTVAQKAAIEDRVITYKVRTRNNEIYNVQSVAAQRSTTLADEYKASTNKIGSITISDTTYLVDATKPEVSGAAFKKFSGLGTFAELKDEVEYEVYAWDKSATSNVFSLVIVTKAGSTISADARFAVAKKTINSATVLEDEIGYAVTALYDGQEQVLEIAGDARVYRSNSASTPAFIDQSATQPGMAVSATSLSQGEAFFFTKDSDGLIDAIYPVTGDFVAVANAEGIIKANTWDATFKNASNYDVQLVEGIITSVTNSNVQFGIPSTAPTTGEFATGNRLAALAGKKIIDKNISDAAGDSKGVYDYPVASDCVVYTYDHDGTYNKTADRIYEGGGIKASNFTRFEFKNDNSYIWLKTATDAADANVNDLLATDDYNNEVVYGAALIVDGAIVAIYQAIY